jgi:hypothetical protein
MCGKMREILFDYVFKRVVGDVDELLNLAPENIQLKYARAALLQARPERDATFKQPAEREVLIAAPIKPPKGANLALPEKDSDFSVRKNGQISDTVIALGLSSRATGIASDLSDGDLGDEQEEKIPEDFTWDPTYGTPRYARPVWSTGGVQNEKSLNRVIEEASDLLALRAARSIQEIIDRDWGKIQEEIGRGHQGAHTQHILPGGTLDFTGRWILNNGLTAEVQERRKDGGWAGVIFDEKRTIPMTWDEYGKDPELETNGDYDLKDRIRSGARYNHHN